MAVVCLLAVMAAPVAAGPPPLAGDGQVLASAGSVSAHAPIAATYELSVRQLDLSPAPESGSWFAFATGGVGLVAYVRRRKSSRRRLI